MMCPRFFDPIISPEREAENEELRYIDFDEEDED